MNSHLSTRESSQPELNVSIAGGSHDAMAVALDQAMARLNVITGSDTPADSAQALPPFDSTLIGSLIEAICKAENRRTAIEELVRFLNTIFPGTSIRAGLGFDSLNRLFDARLGWLGPESSLHAKCRQRWPGQPADDQDGAAQARTAGQHDAEPLSVPDGIQFEQPEGTGRCVVWIDDGDPSRRLPQLLAPAQAAIAAAIWSRPARSLPRFAVRLARRSSIALGAIGALLIVAAIWPLHYRIRCQSLVETTAARLVATPYEATLLRANVKPGDTVRAGDVLLVLDGRPLRLEREEIEAERQQLIKEHNAALANGKIAAAQQAALKEQQLSRRHELLTDRLNHLEVISPIDGVIVSGDLDRYVGTPLQRGQTLMEVASMDQMVLEVEIPEYEIGYVDQGAAAKIKIDAIGGPALRSQLDDLFPRAELRDDRNVFIGKVQVDNSDRRLRPGMRGEAVVYGPLRPWIWSWIRGSVEQMLWWMGY